MNMNDETNGSRPEQTEKSDCGCANCAGCGEKNVSEKFTGNLARSPSAETYADRIASQGDSESAILAMAPLPDPSTLPPKGEPGKWESARRKTPVHPDFSRSELAKRTIPGNVYRPGSQPTGPKSFAPGLAANTVAGPASIVELARSLKSDADLIFEWVYNNVENLPSFGLSKGGLGALLDNMGNSFDQADLMVQLLRQAGYTANYVFGDLTMNTAQLSSWLGSDSDPLNLWVSRWLLDAGGVPTTDIYWNGVDWVIDFSHCWVQVNIGGTNYYFDPAIKSYTTKTKIDLATAMGYNATTFMNGARSGATINADYVQNMNRSNIRTSLDTMTGNLVTWIKNNANGAGLDDILGGRNIVQSDASSPIRNTVHPNLKAGSTPTVWATIPDAYKIILHIVYDSIDVQFFSNDLAGKRMTLFFNTSHQAELRLDGTLIGTSNAQGVGTWNQVLFEITHPYVGGYCYQYAWHTVWADKPYLLGNSWGNVGGAAVDKHSRKLKELQANFTPTDDESVLGEFMATMWKTWCLNGTKVTDIVNRLTNCVTVHQHQCGLIGWYDTPLTDVGAVVLTTYALDTNPNSWIVNDTVIDMHGVALEEQLFKQFCRIDGVSTTPLIDIANTGGQKIYDAKTSNWTGTVRPSLVNYSSGDLDGIKLNAIDKGYRVGIPENGLITRGSWTGFGYYAIPGAGTYGIITGGLKGGGGAQYVSLLSAYDQWSTAGGGFSCPPPGTGPQANCGVYDTLEGTKCICTMPEMGVGNNGQAYGNGFGGSYIPGRDKSFDPIDMRSGAFLYEATDLTVGTGEFPYALAFKRSYDSSARFQEDSLGRGWRHELMIAAFKSTFAAYGLGAQTVTGAAAAIVELFTTIDIQTDVSQPFDKYITCALANQWFVDNLSDNCVYMLSGQSSLTFVKLPDGSYASPASDNGTLTMNVDGTYKYTSLTGSVLNFNSGGQLATWVEPNGVTVTFTYASGGFLQTVSNNLTRQLTLTYTNNRLTSVSDGTGRSVSFSTDLSGNLTSVTDPNGKVWTHEYDAPGRMTKFFNPANPLVPIAVNTYDTLDRVKEQRDVNNSLWQYYFAGSRSEEKNPNNKSTVTYFNQFGSAFKKINQVGKKWSTVYDGRNRPIKTIAPEGNSVETVYDAKNRVVQSTIKPKPGSLLADIVTSATYDTTWGKLKTSTDALGRVTTLNYDPANGNLLSVVSPAVTGLGSSTVTMTYNARGQVLTVTAPDGIVSQNNYHGSNETLLSTVADFGVGRLNLTASFGYNSRGDITSVQDPRGNTSTIDVDVMRRPSQVTVAAPFSYVTKFTYDDNGNQIKVERQTNDVANPWQTSQATYRADNKLLTTIDPQGRITTVDYDILHRVWKTTDSLSRVVTRAYDDANRLSTMTDPASIVVQTNTYTDNGLLATMKDARNFTTTWSYDGFDRSIKTTYPDTTYEQVVSFDANSNPLSVTTRSGATVTLTYDEVNRVKTKTPSGQPTVTTVYDIAGRVTTISTPTVAGDPSSGTFSLFYDTAGRFYKEQYPDTKSVVHVLDANGNITKTTYPDGSYFVDRVYDQLNRLTDIKLNGAVTSAVTFSYDALSRRTKLSYENGTSTSYSYESDNDLSSLQQTFTGSAVGFNYAFDDVGQMLSQRTTDPANYRWTPPAPATTTYAAANNINQYPTVGGTGFTYSTDGSLTNDGTFKFEYNTERMLTRVRNAGTNAVISDYLYDPSLRQRQKIVGAVKTNFYYAGWQRIADYDGTANTLQQRYVYGTGLDEVLIQVTSGGTKTYFHGNHQGSVVSISDSAGAVLSRFKYSPYGESPSMTGTTHGYTGQRFDSETGLYYYKMRHYSPKLGRFLQADPIGYGGGANLYAYTSNNPLRSSDTLGLIPDGEIPDDEILDPEDGLEVWQVVYGNLLSRKPGTYAATVSGAISVYRPILGMVSPVTYALDTLLESSLYSVVFNALLQSMGIVDVPVGINAQGVFFENLVQAFVGALMGTAVSREIPTTIVTSVAPLSGSTNIRADLVFHDTLAPFPMWAIGEVKSSVKGLPSFSTLRQSQRTALTSLAILGGAAENSVFGIQLEAEFWYFKIKINPIFEYKLARFKGGKVGG